MFSFFLLSKEFFLNDPSPPPISSSLLRFAPPETKDCGESKVLAVTDVRVFPCFNRKPILVTFQV